MCHDVLCCAVLCGAESCVMACCSVACGAESCVMACCAVLCGAESCVMACCAVLYCVVLSHVSWHAVLCCEDGVLCCGVWC